jgi:hypothetical protein
LIKGLLSDDVPSHKNKIFWLQVKKKQQQLKNSKIKKDGVERKVE